MTSFFSTSRQIVLVIAFAAFGITGLFILGSNNRDNAPENANKAPLGPSVSSAGANKRDASNMNWDDLFRFGKDVPIERRFSAGESVLVTIDSSPDKQEGTKLYGAGNFENAIVRFNASLALNRNDPETWIYLNNAKANLSKQSVKIAVAVPIGGNVNVSKEILRGVAQYQNEVNQGGGIRGKSLEVVIANDDNDPTAGKNIAEYLVKDTSIMALVGHQSSDVSIVAAPIYVKGRLVMVSPTSYAQSFSSLGKGIYRTTPSSRAIADSLAKQAVNSLHYRRIAICIDSKSQDSQSFRDDFISSLYEYGGKVTSTDCDFSSPTFNVDQLPAEAVRDGADGLLLSPGIEKLDRAIDVVQANKGKIPLLASPSMYTYEILQRGRADANGMIISVAWDPQAANNDLYEKNAKALWGGVGSWRTVMAYDAAKVVAVGLQTALDRQQLAKVLSEPSFTVKGATETVEFLPTGDRNMAGTLMKIIPGVGSGTGYEFASLKVQPAAIGGATLSPTSETNRKSGSAWK